MDLAELRAFLDTAVGQLKTSDRSLLRARLEALIAAFPFNEFEYALMFLLSKKAISFDEYEHVRDEYVSTNKYLSLYGLAPRIFGEIWGQEHLRDLDGRFEKPSRTLDPKYLGQYDLWIKGVKVEVKACRAINTKKRGDLTSKALHFISTDPFWMNYQQIKLKVADVFVFIGVWVDQILYWVLSNEDVAKNKYLSHQHRGGIEYQIGITNRNILQFEEFQTTAENLASRVLEKRKH